VIIAVDVGSVRVGVAASDPQGRMAFPVETVARDPAGGSDLARLAKLVRERGAREVVVGLPTGLSGVEGEAARSCREYARRLAERVAPVPVRLADERLSTVTANRQLRSGSRRGREQREVVDQAAAVVILQTALDARARSAM
jgi:putative Holliday junction resolvase